MRISNGCLAGTIMMAMGGVALGIVLYLEHILKLAPCEICLLERWPWRVLILIGAVTAFALPRRYAKYGILVGLMCLSVSLGLSALHIGVEHKWWASPFASCRAPSFHGGSFKDWMAAMPVRPNKPCDAPDFVWKLPLSVTEFGGVYALLCFIVSLLSFRANLTRA